MINDAMSANIVASIIGGFLVWVFLELLRRAWSRYILPLFNKGIAIEGVWVTDITFPDGERNKHRITLRRFGHTVWGTAICEEGWGKGFRYKVTGTFKNLVLAAEYEIIEKRRLERGSFTLMLIDGGSKLRGYLAYLDNDSNKIETTACEWLAEGVPRPAGT